MEIKPNEYFNNSFDYIYGLHINQKEKNRLNSIKNKFDIKINLFEGIDGKIYLEDKYKEYLSKPFETNWEILKKKKRLSIGAFGHLYSFINIINHAKQNNFNKILILEGDILIHYNIFELFIKFKKNISDYKILYLGAGIWNENIILKSTYYIPNETTGTFAIAFDKSIYDELLFVWEKKINPTDICLFELCLKYKNECYVIYPNIIICNLENSSIQEKKNRSYLYKKFNWDLNLYSF